MRRTVLCCVAIVAGLASGAVTVHGNDGQSRRVYQTSHLNVFMTANPVGGAATLLRGRNRLDMHVTTSGLNPNSSFSVWWVIFNNPEACDGPCNGPDLANPDVRGAVFWAAGFVTGADGTGYASGYVAAGALPEGVDVETGSGLRRGNGLGAEVHIVVRTHGMINLGHVHEQIGTFGGACNPTCANVQAAVFPPAS